MPKTKTRTTTPTVKFSYAELAALGIDVSAIIERVPMTDEKNVGTEVLRILHRVKRDIEAAYQTHVGTE